MEKTYTITEPEEFQAVIDDCLWYHKNQNNQSLCIALRGDLGAGKTTFTQALGRFLGVTEPITSPTFTIMKQYPLEHELFDTLMHIDAYRFESEAEATPLRLEELFNTPRLVISVEWPERIENLLPKEVVVIQITIKEGETRLVTVTYPDSGSKA